MIPIGEFLKPPVADVENCLVVEPTPLKNMSSSVGMMKFPIYGENVPNHQPI